MEYSLAHLVLPILMPNSIRTTLPPTARTKMHVWLEKNPQALIDFASRARGYVPYTRAATLFAYQRRALALDDEGRLVVGTGKVGKPTGWPETSDAKDCYKRAGFLGKWLALAGDPKTIYTMWGVKP